MRSRERDPMPLAAILFLALLSCSRHLGARAVTATARCLTGALNIRRNDQVDAARPAAPRASVIALHSNVTTSTPLPSGHASDAVPASGPEPAPADAATEPHLHECLNHRNAKPLSTTPTPPTTADTPAHVCIGPMVVDPPSHPCHVSSCPISGAVLVDDAIWTTNIHCIAVSTASLPRPFTALQSLPSQSSGRQHLGSVSARAGFRSHVATPNRAGHPLLRRVVKSADLTHSILPLLRHRSAGPTRTIGSGPARWMVLATCGNSPSFQLSRPTVTVKPWPVVSIPLSGAVDLGTVGAANRVPLRCHPAPTNRQYMATNRTARSSAGSLPSDALLRSGARASAASAFCWQGNWPDCSHRTTTFVASDSVVPPRSGLVPGRAFRRPADVIRDHTVVAPRSMSTTAVRMDLARDEATRLESAANSA